MSSSWWVGIGSCPEEAYVRLYVKRQERVARIPKPDIELEPDEEPCRQCGEETHVDQLFAGICGDRRRQAGQQMTGRGPFFGKRQRAMLATLLKGPHTLVELIQATAGQRETVKKGLQRLKERGLVRAAKPLREPHKLTGPGRYELTGEGRRACG